MVWIVTFLVLIVLYVPSWITYLLLAWGVIAGWRLFFRHWA